MASAFDPLSSNYITPTWQTSTPPPSTPPEVRHIAGEGRLGIEHGVGDWGVVPGVPPFIISGGQNGRRVMAFGGALAGQTPEFTSADRSFANVWSGAPFTADHYAEAAHNPPINLTQPHADRTDCGPAVRQDPNSDSCYMMGLWYHDDGNGHPDMSVVRYNNGVRTVLAIIPAPHLVHPQDWWYLQLQVWGYNPTRLRVITKAPLCYVPGTALLDDGYLPGLVDYDIPEFGGVVTVWQYGDARFAPDGAFHNWAEYGAPSSQDLSPIGVFDTSKRGWIIWEGEDASAQQLRTGQPGIRGHVVVGGTLTVQGLADFTAADIDDRLTARIISGTGPDITVGGYRTPSTTVAVTGAATIGAVSYPDAASWICVVSGVVGDVTLHVASSDTQAVDLAVSFHAEITSLPLDCALLIAAGLVTTPQSSRFLLPGPMSIWDGSQFVPAPLRLFDGSTLT